ncbi:MAG: hypothetical protein HY435_02990 [Candidatus Liptonbacteria bacterium]|nr:hypothetical protein [Candidatus Liptonbacteria bacterium]
MKRAQRTPHNPYLSLVVVGRNDNYGEGFLDRFQIFLNNQFYLWEKYALNAELIIVEWNPPANQPKLKNVLAWPRQLPYGSVRIVEVPPAVHRTVPHGDRQYFFEYFGKNVGARRARGEYVLCTNPDLVYSSELVGYFGSRRLDEHSVYRVDRHDLPKDAIPRALSPEEQLAFCADNFRYVHNNYGAMFVRGEYWFGARNARRMLTYLRNRARFFPHPPPYMNAAGDFFLMHKKWWDFFGGYPEVNHYAYPDALCFMALAAGLTQKIFPYPIYHQDHERGGVESGRPRSDFERNKPFYLKMLRAKKPWLPSGEDWGLAKEALPEEVIF